MSTRLDEAIHRLSGDVAESVRRDLQQALRTLRDAGDVPSTLICVARVFEGADGLLEQIARAAGTKCDGHNLDSQITKLADKGVVPALISTNLHWIRVHANKARHRDESVSLSLDDAETSLNRALRIVRWYYCEYPQGPRLETIEAPAARRTWRPWPMIAAVVLFLVAAYLGRNIWPGNGGGNAAEQEKKGPGLQAGLQEPPPVQKPSDSDGKKSSDGKESIDGKTSTDDAKSSDVKQPPKKEPAPDPIPASPKGKVEPEKKPPEKKEVKVLEPEKKEPPPPKVRRTVLNNDGSPSLVLKNPAASFLDPDNQVGLAEVGAEIRYVPGAKVFPGPNRFINLVNIEILSGRLAGKTGWVSANVVQVVD